MSWSTPRTWVAAELVTASIMNTHVRDQFLMVATIGAHRCHAYNSGNQNVTAGSTNALNMDSEVYDPSGMHSTSSNTYLLTVPAAGLYRVYGRALVTNNNNGTATLHLYKNGSPHTPAIYESGTTAAADFEDRVMQVAAIVSMAASDNVYLAGQAVTNDFGFTGAQLMVEGITSVV